MSSAAEKLVCSICVREPFLQETIGTAGQAGTCAYCGSPGGVISIGELAGRVGAVLEDFFYPWQSEQGRSIIDVIGEQAIIEPVIAEDIRVVLSDRHASEFGITDGAANPFGPGTPYRQRAVDAWPWEHDWLEFSRSLRHDSRFFNRAGQELLAKLLEGIDGQTARWGRAVIVEGGPGSSYATLYRARVFEDSEKLSKAVRRPDIELGPPPGGAAAGRMNAVGIRVFYAATIPRVAIAEVRPPVGSKVLVGRFEITVPLRLLDLTVFSEIRDSAGSRFDPAHVERLKRNEFLRGLGDRFAQPVLPSDEPLGYLATQAVADYLANVIDPPLDGIIYPSIQVGHEEPRAILLGGRFQVSCNVVLFPNASGVKPMKDPQEVSVPGDALWQPSSLRSGGPDVRIDDPAEREYIVWEAGNENADAPGDAAPLRLAEIILHTVTHAEYKTKTSEIRRLSIPPDDSRQKPEGE